MRQVAFNACAAVAAERWPADGANPHYAWQLYHLWANLAVLNRLRRARGLNTLSLRPHAGECAGSGTHLAAAYLLAQSINHGVELRSSIGLQYLYLLDQVGMSVSPLSNDFLFLRLKDSPFPKFFAAGMNVTLSTDDPLLFHLSSEPLLEEYTVARAAFGLSMTDLCEIARNSVLQSDFPAPFKASWLGAAHAHEGELRNDEHRTNVCGLREAFRWNLLSRERSFVKACGGSGGGKGGGGGGGGEGESASGGSVMRAAFPPTDGAEAEGRPASLDAQPRYSDGEALGPAKRARAQFE